MSVLSFNAQITGLVGVAPRIVYITTADSLATVTTAGWINPVLLNEGQTIYPTDEVHIIYGASGSPLVGTFGIFLPTVSNGIVTLAAWVDSGNVLLPVVSGDVPVFNGTAGQIKDSGASLSDATKTKFVMASGAVTAGNLAVYADTSGTVGQSTAILATNVVVKNAPNTFTGTGSVILPKVNGTEATNAVTASGVAGVITTSTLTTAGGSSYAITWTNTVMTATSTVLLSIQGGTNTTENVTLKIAPGSGTATLTIYNNTAATALNGTILIGYLLV